MAASLSQIPENHWIAAISGRRWKSCAYTPMSAARRSSHIICGICLPSPFTVWKRMWCGWRIFSATHPLKLPESIRWPAFRNTKKHYPAWTLYAFVEKYHIICIMWYPSCSVHRYSLPYIFTKCATTLSSFSDCASTDGIPQQTALPAFPRRVCFSMPYCPVPHNAYYVVRLLTKAYTFS